MQIDLQKYIDEYYGGSVYLFSKEAQLYENPAREVWSHITNRMISYQCIIDTKTGEIIRTKKFKKGVLFCDDIWEIKFKCKEWRK
jgi:hypothetical protein